MTLSMLAWTVRRSTTLCVMTKMATAPGKVTVKVTVKVTALSKVVAHYLMDTNHSMSMIGTVQKN